MWGRDVNDNIDVDAIGEIKVDVASEKDDGLPTRVSADDKLRISVFVLVVAGLLPLVVPVVTVAAVGGLVVTFDIVVVGRLTNNVEIEAVSEKGER